MVVFFFLCVVCGVFSFLTRGSTHKLHSHSFLRVGVCVCLSTFSFLLFPVSTLSLPLDSVFVSRDLGNYLSRQPTDQPWIFIHSFIFISHQTRLDSTRLDTRPPPDLGSSENLPYTSSPFFIYTFRFDYDYDKQRQRQQQRRHQHQ